MTALAATQADMNVAMLLTGVLIGSIGLGLLWFGRSLWAERIARRAEAVVVETPAARSQRLFDAECDKALAVAELQTRADRLRPVGDVIPMQRDGRWS